MTPTERDDLNERIAEDLGWTFNDDPEVGLWVDPDGSWRSIQLPSFFTDPVCTLLLMRKILAEGRSIHFELVDATKNYVVLSSEFISLKDRIKTCGAIGEAVAVAYAKMRNLK